MSPMADELDPDGERDRGPWPNTRNSMFGFNEVLGHISMYEVEHGRPMLTAIVVGKDTGIPGDGFERLSKHLGFEIGDPMTFWRREFREVVDFWGEAHSDPTRIADALFDEMIEQINRLRSSMRKMSRALASTDDID